MSGGVGRGPFADQPMPVIDGDVVLIAEGRNRQIDWLGSIPLWLGLGVFGGPARVAILLSDLRGLVLPGVGDAAFADRLLLVLCVALLRRGHDGGIDDLAAHRQKAAGA